MEYGRRAPVIPRAGQHPRSAGLDRDDHRNLPFDDARLRRGCRELDRRQHRPDAPAAREAHCKACPVGGRGLCQRRGASGTFRAVASGSDFSSSAAASASHESQPPSVGRTGRPLPCAARSHGSAPPRPPGPPRIRVRGGGCRPLAGAKVAVRAGLLPADVPFADTGRGTGSAGTRNPPGRLRLRGRRGERRSIRARRYTSPSTRSSRRRRGTLDTRGDILVQTEA